MTEQEWFTGSDPTALLDFIQAQASARQLRLFALACCRRIWQRLAATSRQAVKILERCVDGHGTAQERQEAIRSAEREEIATVGPARAAARAVSSAWAATDHARSAAAKAAEDGVRERLCQAGLLRCFFGNPFRPVALDPGWLTPTVRQVAQAIYDERRFTEMGILADVLEEAGCTDASVLGHCRQGGEHARGCFVVDLVLGRR
jgi:hypothetical protein